MLKLTDEGGYFCGCVLKHKARKTIFYQYFPASFGRLCVETNKDDLIKLKQWPASFGRLCVETNTTNSIEYDGRPAAFRRLCAETLVTTNSMTTYSVSRL